MNDIASLLVWELGRAALLVTLAAVMVAIVLRAVRSRSPRVHRVAWCAVLLQGWLLVRLPVAVPWYALEPSPPGRGQGEGLRSEGDIEPLSLPGRGQGEGDANSLSLDGRGWGEGERPLAVNDEPLPSPPAPLSPRPSPSPSLAREGSFQGPLSLDERGRSADALQSLSLDGRGQGEGDLQPLSLDGRGQGEGESATASATHFPALVTAIEEFAPAITALWLAGIVGCVALWLVGYIRFLRRLPVGLAADEEWLDQWRELQEQHRIRRTIPLRVTDDLGPLLCRRLRGYELLVPAALWRDLSASQRSAILRHELAHYRRGDVWKSLAARVLALPQWFNPLAWLAVRRFDEAAEWACDLAATQGQPRATDYARALVRLGEAASQHASYSPAAHGRSLAVRVRRLLSSGTLEDSTMKKLVLIAAALAIVVVGIVRLELVAREPTTDEKTADDAIQPPSVEVAANDSRALFAAATNAAQEAQTKAAAGDYRAAAEAAAKAYEATKAAYETDSVNFDLLYNASLRLLNAQRNMSKTREEDIAAVEAYVARTQHIHDKAKALFGAGARGGEAENYYTILYYLEDAKEMLKAAKARPGPPREPGTPPTATGTESSGQPVEHDYRAVAEAAGKTYESIARAFEDDTATLAHLCNWSQKLLDAERKAATTSKEDIAALEAYLARMQKIHDTIKKLFDAGARGGEAEKFYGMVFYVEEAKEMLKAAKTRAAREDANSQPTPESPFPTTRGASVREELFKRQVELTDQLNRLQVRIEEAQSKSKDPKAATRLREEMRLLQGQIAALNEKLKALEHTNRGNLRFDGRTFDQWREELLTELKPERRTDAILAFRAFAVNGYGRDAAQAIVEVMRGHDVWKIEGNLPEGKLKETAIEAFGTIDRADAVPVLVEALKSGNANQQQFAARVFQEKVQGDRDAAAALVAAVGHKDAKVRQTAISALTRYSPLPEGSIKAFIAATRDEEKGVRGNAIGVLSFPKARSDEVAQALIAAIGNSDPEIRHAAINGLAQYNPRPEGAVAALRKALKDQDPSVVVAAIYALVPQASTPDGSMGGMGAMGGPMGMPGGMPMGGMGGGMGGMGMGRGGMGGMRSMGPGMLGGLRAGDMEGGAGRFGGMMPAAAAPAATMPRAVAPMPAMGGGRFGPGGLGAAAPASPPTGLEPIYVPEFLDLLQHENPEILNAAIAATYALGPKCKPALPTALAWLRGDELSRRFWAFTIIGSIGPEAKEAVPELVKIIEDANRDGTQVDLAVDTLGLIGPAAKEAIPALEKLIERLPTGPVYPSSEIRAARARAALDKIRQPAESGKRPESGAVYVPSSSNQPMLLPQHVTALLQVQAASAEGRSEYRIWKLTQVGLLRSHAVMRAALREPGIARLSMVMDQSDPVAWLEKDLKMHYVDDILHVELNDLDRNQMDEAAKVVNAVVEAYLKLHGETAAKTGDSLRVKLIQRAKATPNETRAQAEDQTQRAP